MKIPRNKNTDCTFTLQL